MSTATQDVPIHRQLWRAWRLSDRTIAEILVAAELECSPTSLGRKLGGRQILSTDEAERLARALACEIRYGGASSATSQEGR